MSKMVCLAWIALALCFALCAVEAAKRPDNKNARRFGTIAKEAGTDKAIYHWYHHAYEELIEPIRHQPIRFMEIGLGCNMKYGPGRSFKVWDEFFTHPNAQLFYMEIDGECVEKMKIKPRNGKVFVGSQSNTTFMQEVARSIAGIGGLDVLVDDGGHNMVEQFKTWQILWQHIRPGGLLVMEDVHSSYMEGLGGSKDTAIRMDFSRGEPTTFMGKVAELIDGLNCDVIDRECDMTLLSVHCYHHLCAMRKANPANDDHVVEGEYLYPSIAERGGKKKSTT